MGVSLSPSPFQNREVDLLPPLLFLLELAAFEEKGGVGPPLARFPKYYCAKETTDSEALMITFFVGNCVQIS